MSDPLLTPVKLEDLTGARRSALDESVERDAAEICRDVRLRGLSGLLEWRQRLDGVGMEEPLILERSELLEACDEVAPETVGLLERTAERISTFAEAQRTSLTDLRTEIAGGRAGHRVSPVRRAGCYAPGGRYPLPSSVLMTAVTARAAGVREVWCASPSRAPVMLAAAAVAGVDGLVVAGGAHAIAGMAYGAGELPACDVVVGPGNAWVTAAKHWVSRDVGIDFLAGPSELVVVADHTADPARVAADLLAQAEHDPAATVILITLDASLTRAVEAQLEEQLEQLETGDVARAALVANGRVLAVADRVDAVLACDLIAPEHLQLQVDAAEEIAPRLSAYGGLFVGHDSAEVFGDYGAGPNHVLPTGGHARSTGGLSVLTFLRVATWLELDPGREAGAGVARDAATLARLEGLVGHARAAECRVPRANTVGGGDGRRYDARPPANGDRRA